MVPFATNALSPTSGGLVMADKSLKTFNLNRSTIEIVRRKHNQSAFVDRAIVKLHKQDESVDLAGYTTRQLMWALSRREDCPESIIAIVERLMT